MRDTISGALQATAYILKICEKHSSAKEIKREIEYSRDWLLSETANDVRGAMPRR